jgi:hypothetical protein
MTRWTKQDPTHMFFKEIINKKLNQISNFQPPKNPSMFLFPFFFSILTRQHFFSYLFGPSHTLSHIFFTGPISSLAQPHIQSTNSISLGHLRPLDTSHRLQPPWSSCRSLLCCSPLAPWSRLTSSLSSPPIMITPHCLPFPVSISPNQHH